MFGGDQWEERKVKGEGERGLNMVEVHCMQVCKRKNKTQ
jgi:hypothetical protein